jgi:hypothetical protein
VNGIELGTFKEERDTAVLNLQQGYKGGMNLISNFDICLNCKVAVSYKENTRM